MPAQARDHRSVRAGCVRLAMQCRRRRGRQGPDLEVCAHRTWSGSCDVLGGGANVADGTLERGAVGSNDSAVDNAPPISRVFITPRLQDGLTEHIVACMDVHSNDAGDLLITKGD